jgi:hypothetical protein
MKPAAVFILTQVNRLVIYCCLLLLLYLHAREYDIPTDGLARTPYYGVMLLLLLPTFISTVLFFPLVVRIEKVARSTLLDTTFKICIFLVCLSWYVVVIVAGVVLLVNVDTRVILLTNASFILAQHCLRCPNKPGKRRQCCATRRRTVQQPQPDEEQIVRELRRLQQMARSAPTPTPAPPPAPAPATATATVLLLLLLLLLL